MLRLALGADPDTRTPALALLGIDDALPSLVPQVLGVWTAGVQGDRSEDRLPVMGAAVAAALRALLWHPSESPHWLLPDVAAVEWQRIRPFKDPRPNDILNLVSVAGMVVGALEMLCGQNGKSVDLEIPQPSEWKGTIPKSVQQARVRARLKLLCPRGSGRIEQELMAGHPVLVRGSDDLTSTARGHVIDAIGLAWWALERRGWVNRHLV